MPGHPLHAVRAGLAEVSRLVEVVIDPLHLVRRGLRADTRGTWVVRGGSCGDFLIKDSTK